MANLHFLAQKVSLIRLRDTPTLVASATDGENARLDSKERLDRLKGALDFDLTVVEAIDARIIVRPPLPQPQTLQDLVRSGRRRLERERLGVRRSVRDVRVLAVDKLRHALDV